MDFLYLPPLAFLIYVLLVGVLLVIGKHLAGTNSVTTSHEVYSSGEVPPAEDDRSLPGYRPFFIIALFFAVLHLGVVVLATSHLTGMAIVYLLGLILALIALILR